MKYHAGILWGTPMWDHQLEVLILAHTPGVPVEWMYAALGLEWRRRRKLRAMIDRTLNDEFLALVRENAASVMEGDGWRMLEAVGPSYAGPIPLMSQLELWNDRRSNGELSKVLGVDREKVRRWRTEAVFDPLTGARLIPNRGTRIVGIQELPPR